MEINASIKINYADWCKLLKTGDIINSRGPEPARYIRLKYDGDRSLTASAISAHMACRAWAAVYDCGLTKPFNVLIPATKPPKASLASEVSITIQDGDIIMMYDGCTQYSTVIPCEGDFTRVIDDRAWPEAEPAFATTVNARDLAQIAKLLPKDEPTTLTAFNDVSRRPMPIVFAVDGVQVLTLPYHKRR